MSDPNTTPVPDDEPTADQGSTDEEAALDEQLEETFPASDPPANY